MVNPFDRTFFRFLCGFALILAASFTILYFVGRYSTALDQQASRILQ